MFRISRKGLATLKPFLSYKTTLSYSTKSVGLVGTGNVGSAVAVGLREAGYPLKAYDLNKNNYEFLQGIGTVLVDNAEEVVRDVDVLITALPKPKHVKAVMDEGRLLHAMKKDSIWVDHTTTDYNETIRLCKLAESLGVRGIEAPLTGGITLLKEKNMTVFVGGEENTAKECKPVLDAYTGTFLYFGPVGKATIAKVISNMLAAAHLVSAGEALMIAKKAGLHMENFFDGIRFSAGNSYVFETEVPLMFKGTFDPNFTIDLHCKDLSLGKMICKSCGVPWEKLGVMDSTEKIYRKAMEKYGENVGSSYPAKMIEDELEESLYLKNWEDWSYSIEKVTGGSFGVVQKKTQTAPSDNN
jgi:3-hydroxyisobutyrate dehydrogenase